jgi:hypothetical protein
VAQGICASEAEALERVRKFLFLAGSEPGVLARTILYGGTLLFNNADSYADKEYTADLNRLVRFARRVWVREPFSAMVINQVQGEWQRCAHGTDCSQLLDQNFADVCGIEINKKDPGAQKKLGVFIGRSHLDQSKIKSLLTAVQTRMQLDFTWIDWGRPPFFLDRKKEFKESIPAMGNVMPVKDDAFPAETLAALLEVDFLISDTYHTCVNAWNFGVPAVCLIDNRQTPLAVNSGSELAGRDKRVAFYWTYNAAPFLLYSSDLDSEAGIQKKAADIVALFADQMIIRNIRKQMSQHVKLSETLLLRTIQDVAERIIPDQ